MALSRCEALCIQRDLGSASHSVNFWSDCPTTLARLSSERTLNIIESLAESTGVLVSYEDPPGCYDNYVDPAGPLAASGGSPLGTGATIGLVVGCFVGGALLFSGAFLVLGPGAKATVTLSTPSPVKSAQA